MKRVVFGILLIFLAFITPWWVSLLLSILGLFYFDNLYEVIFVGLIIDTLYGAHFEYFGFNLFFTLILTLCFYIIGKFKTQIFI